MKQKHHVSHTKSESRGKALVVDAPTRIGSLLFQCLSNRSTLICEIYGNASMNAFGKEAQVTRVQANTCQYPFTISSCCAEYHPECVLTDVGSQFVFLVPGLPLNVTNVR